MKYFIFVILFVIVFIPVRYGIRALRNFFAGGNNRAD